MDKTFVECPFRLQVVQTWPGHRDFQLPVLFSAKRTILLGRIPIGFRRCCSAVACNLLLLRCRFRDPLQCLIHLGCRLDCLRHDRCCRGDQNHHGHCSRCHSHIARDQETMLLVGIIRLKGNKSFPLTPCSKGSRVVRVSADLKCRASYSCLRGRESNTRTRHI